MTLRRENALSQFNVASYKRAGIRLSFEDKQLCFQRDEGRKNRCCYDVYKNALQVYDFIKSLCPRL